MEPNTRMRVVRAAWHTLWYAGIALIMLYICFPIYWTAISSLKTPSNFYLVQYLPADPTLFAFRLVLADQGFRQSIFNSLLVTFAVVGLTLVFGAMAGYAISRLRFRGRRLVRDAALAMIVVPQIALLGALFSLISDPCSVVGLECKQASLYNTFWALIGTYPMLTLPLTIWFIYAYYRDMSTEIEDAARVDGATLFQSFVHILLPLTAPALIATGLLAFITAWNEYLFPVTFTQSLASRTAPVYMSAFGFVGFGTILSLAASMVLMAPVVVLVMAFGPHITTGLSGLTGNVRAGGLLAGADGTRRFGRVGLSAPEATLLLVLLLGLLVFVSFGVRVLRFPYSVDYGEAPLLAQTLQLANGQNIYRADLSAPPFMVANYPPIYMLTLVPFAKLFGPAFWYGRLVSWLSMIAAALFVGLIVHALTRDRLAGLFGGLMLLSIPYVVHWSELYRIDSLALALSLAGLFVLVRTSGQRWGVLLAAVLLLAAIFTRQSYGLAAPLAACVWLLWVQPKRALLLAGLMAVVGGVLFGLINVLTGGGFWLNIVVANINAFKLDLLKEYGGELWTLMPLAAIGTGLLVVAGWRQPSWRLLAPYALGAAVSALTIGKIGSNVNYLLEFSAAMCLALGAIIAALRPHQLAREVVLAVIAVQFVLLAPGARYQLFTDFRLQGREDAALVQSLVATSDGAILADEDMGALVMAGKPLFYQPFEMTQLARAGVWNQQPLLDAIDRKAFAWILLHRVDGVDLVGDRWTPEMLGAIDRSYKLDRQIGNTYAYRPK